MSVRVHVDLPGSVNSKGQDCRGKGSSVLFKHVIYRVLLRFV